MDNNVLFQHSADYVHAARCEPTS
uniref:Uncharacterized protein n=1 Tax=Anguilla anguilla TaxID=7936 RepID=A0A0E9VLE1_ANGAN